ncbi:unnamed protein product [Penicillium salamii]|uniref:Uncharacterized protein n=1 Tax=Penicillium salamii TaxID=1612424 RepID=A0A9W4NVI1_9EURO|nr:unnamed protein product [Penicillium salamii]
MYSVPSKSIRMVSFNRDYTDQQSVYEHMGTKHHLEWPSTFLAFMAIVFTIPIYVFYWKGPKIREMSPFAQTVAADRKAAGRRVSQCGSGDPDPVERYLSRSSNEVCTRPHV